MKKIFEIKRFWLIFRNDAIAFGRSVTPAFGAVYGVLLLIFVFLIRGPVSQPGYASLFAFLLFAGGYIFTSQAFQELHQPQKGIFYLTLPASILEKILSRMLLTSVVYTISLFISFWLFSMLVSGLDALLWRVSTPIFNPFSKDIFLDAGSYMVTQSIFLFGAAYFKKQHFVKTILSIVGLSFVTISFLFLFTRILFVGDNFLPGWNFQNGALNINGFQAEPFSQMVTKISQIIFWVLTAPYFWAVTYFRLRETEV